MSWYTGAAPYLTVLHAVEGAHGLPTNLLVRIAFQECSWRSEVIDGTKKSSAGAIGMFQLMPQFFPGAGVSWETDANTAAKFLSELYGEFKDWQYAVAAYNWGPGNIKGYLAGTKQVLPLETENYVKGVFTDVPVAGNLLHNGEIFNPNHGPSLDA